MKREESSERLPCLLGDGLAVVREGAVRVRWERVGAEGWRIGGCWPSRDERRELLDDLGNGLGVLIVLPAEPATVTALAQEITVVHDQLHMMTQEADLVEFAVSVLDWLPEPYRSRGLAFADWAEARVSEAPTALLPGLLTDHEAVEFGRGELWFARQVRSGLSARQCLESARYLWRERERHEAMAR
jgi:hypothetical protein